MAAVSLPAVVAADVAVLSGVPLRVAAVVVLVLRVVVVSVSHVVVADSCYTLAGKRSSVGNRTYDRVTSAGELRVDALMGGPEVTAGETVLPSSD